jgi:hypothetical protein
MGMSLHTVLTALPFVVAGVILWLLLRSANREEEAYKDYIIPWYDYVRLGLKMSTGAALVIAFALVGTDFALEGSIAAATKTATGQELLFFAVLAVGLALVTLILRVLWVVPRRIFERIDDWRDARRAAKAYSKLQGRTESP